jgi:hypothetical protein
MKRLRKVAAIVLIGTMVVCGETRRTRAQEPPPDLHMLMNLDLFEPRHNNPQGSAAPTTSPADDSLLDQIRALDSMGYLGNPADADVGDLPAPRAAVRTAPGAEDVGPANAPAPQIPSSVPSDDVEGPLP